MQDGEVCDVCECVEAGFVCVLVTGLVFQARIVSIDSSNLV